MFRVLRAAPSKKFEVCRSMTKNGNVSLSNTFIKTCNGKASISIFCCHFRPISKEIASPKLNVRLALRDGIPPGYTLIYRSNLPNYLMLTQSTVTFAVVLISVGLILTAVIDVSNPKDLAESENVNTTSDDSSKNVYSSSGELLPPPPSPNDFTKDDKETAILLALSLALIVIALYRLLNMIPSRIYTTESKHCIAVLYGSIIPGRITHHEFLAGTLKHVAKNSTFREFLYKDGTGKNMLLMDHFFRLPADLHRLLGKGYVKP